MKKHTHNFKEEKSTGAKTRKKEEETKSIRTGVLSSGRSDLPAELDDGKMRDLVVAGGGWWC